MRHTTRLALTTAISLIGLGCGDNFTDNLIIDGPFHHYRGVVRDSVNANPLSEVAIRFNKYSTMTLQDGSYVLSAQGTSVGGDFLEFSKPGYNTKQFSMPEDLPPGLECPCGEIPLDIELSPSISP